MAVVEQVCVRFVANIRFYENNFHQKIFSSKDIFIKFVFLGLQLLVRTGW